VNWVGVGLCAGILYFLTLTAHAEQNESQTPRGRRVATTAAPEDVLLPPADAQRAQSGLATKVLKTGIGSEHPSDNDCVSVMFQAWRRDGTLFSVSGGLGNQAATQCLRPAMPGIAEALKLMVVGEKRRVWLPADLTRAVVAHHSDKHSDMETPSVDLTFDLELVRIIQAPPTPSDLRPPARGALKLPHGVFMQVLKPGSGSSHPSVTSWLTLDYTGWTSDGKLFESTVLAGHPRLVLLGATLPGWQDALKTMVVGEKVRLWVPAAAAYGEEPDKGLPAGDLIYDVEIVGFE
jgi:FKBP-type peptidyl-prolyl cis-trans isomerase